MRQRPLGNTGLHVSELALGTWGLSGDGYAAVPEVERERVVDRALALGITLFETADAYAEGKMERLLGERVKKASGIVIVTKLGTDREATPARKRFDVTFLRESFERSRARLGQDALDVVLLHNPSDRALERGEATGLLSELCSAGKLRAWGASVGSLAAGSAAIARGAQVIELVHNAFHRSELRTLAADVRERGVGILARSVLAHGLLCGQWPTNKEFAPDDHRSLRWTGDDLKHRIMQLNALRPCVSGNVVSLRAAALRYVLSNELVSAAVLGPRSTLQLDQLVREAGKELPYLTPEALSALDMRLTNVGIGE
jgi:aryl-alcohol dehydrogenase-like predicted oxidoreductase